MPEIPLNTLYCEKGSETERLWEMIRKPTAIQQALRQRKYSRPVEIKKVELTEGSANGSVSTRVTAEGDYNIKVSYRENCEQEDSTYAEETLHLLQELLNPIYFEEAEIKARTKSQLAALGIEELPSGLANMYTSSFLKNVEQAILSFAESIGVNNLRDHFLSERALLIRVFTNSLKSPGLYVSKLAVLDLANLMKQWGVDILSDDERKILLEEQQLVKNHITQMRNLPVDASIEELETINAAQVKERKPLESKISETYGYIVKRLENLSDENISVLFSNLGLQPVLTVENYTIAREFLSKSEPAQIRACILKYITTAENMRLERIHYILRPGGYSSYKVSSEEWFNTHEDHLRRVQCLEMLEEYSDASLAGVLIHLIDEELSQLWVEGAAEHAAITHPMFWDVAENSSLTTNPEYIKLNVGAIRKALESGEVTLPQLLEQAPQVKSKDFSLLPYDVTKIHDAHAALLVEQIQQERRSRAMSRLDTWHILASRVSRFMQAGIEILTQNPTIPSLNYLVERLTGISYLMQEYTSVNLMNSFLAELVAKSIKMYLLGKKEDLGDMYAGNYTFLLTSLKPQEHTRRIRPGESIWSELIDRIIEALNSAEDDGKLILRLIQAKNVNEVGEIVGYNFG